jgi:hypothetical protein
MRVEGEQRNDGRKNREHANDGMATIRKIPSLVSHIKFEQAQMFVLLSF